MILAHQEKIIPTPILTINRILKPWIIREDFRLITSAN